MNAGKWVANAREANREQREKMAGNAPKTRYLGWWTLARESAVSLGEQAKKIPTDKSWDFKIWWSWGDLNPRPQALFGQIYMFSGLI